MTVMPTAEKGKSSTDFVGLHYALENINTCNKTGHRGYRYSGVQFSRCSVLTTSLHLEWDKYLALLANKVDYGGKCNNPLPLYQNFSGGVIML